MRQGVKVCLFVAMIGIAGCQPGYKTIKGIGPHHRSAVVIDRELEPVFVGQTISKNTVFRMQLRHGPLRGTFFAGPDPHVPDPKDRRPVKVTIHNTVPYVVIEDGWIWTDGWGEAETDRVSGSIEGTKMLVQEDDGTHRVYLLSSGKVLATVIDPPGADERTLTDPYTYVELRPGAERFEDVESVPGPETEIGSFVEYVKQIVRELQE
jgi:hypothetical protein